MTRDAATAHTFFETLGRTQWLAPAEVVGYQTEVLARTLRHAWENVPAYRRRLLPLFPDGHFDPAGWPAVPLLDKRELLDDWEDYQARAVPTTHGLVRAVETSGSTGRPLTVRLTELENLARITASYRLMVWHELDQRRALAMIRRPQAFDSAPGSVAAEHWGFLWAPPETLGPRLRLPLDTPIPKQLAWLAQRRPAYVNTLPSNLLRLAVHARSAARELPALAGVISVAELLTPDVRATIRRAFGCETCDVYASAEGGIVAHECPVSGQLHVQSELVRVEVLDGRGEPSAPGTIGELVLTPLYNFAMPLVRYRTGDLAELGPPCPCGRGLPTLERVLGRARQLFLDAEGAPFTPALERERMSLLLGTDGWCLVQTAPGRAVLRHAPTGRPTDAAVEAAARALPAGYRVDAEAREGFGPRPGHKWHHFERDRAFSPGPPCAGAGPALG